MAPSIITSFVDMSGYMIKLVIQQEFVNITHKQYLRKVEQLERAGDEEGLAALESQRMEDLEHNLDKDFVMSMDLGEFDEELEAEYGDLL